jgi:serine/threonine protein kinase
LPHNPDFHHQPQYLLYPPLVSRLWALCSFSAPSIRLIDFTESFPVPFAEHRRLPGTPRSVAAPELLLKVPSEVTMAIDVWALGCIIYQLLGQGGPSIRAWEPFADHMADIMELLGGEKNVPETFRTAFHESGAVARHRWTRRMRRF